MLANITQITDMLWMGGDTDPDASIASRQIEDIVTNTNIECVLDLRLEWNDKELWKANDPYGFVQY